jgi:hypothetical protein
MSRPHPNTIYVPPFVTYYLGHVNMKNYDAKLVHALFKQSGIETVRLSYSLNAPSPVPDSPSLLGVKACAETQEQIDHWLPTINNILQPFIDHNLMRF